MSDDVMYQVAPIDGARGRCESCGCRLQTPYDEGGTIWLTPWHEYGDGRCLTCHAFDENVKALGALEHWCRLNKPYQVTVTTGSSTALVDQDDEAASPAGETPE